MKRNALSSISDGGDDKSAPFPEALNVKSTATAESKVCLDSNNDVVVVQK